MLRGRQTVPSDPLRHVTGPTIGSACFDAFYFQHCLGKPYQRDDEWLGFFGRMADRIVADLAPARVLDAGCALGLLVEALRARGVEAFGIDLSEFAIGHVHESIRPFCRQGSITDPLDRRYDLIVSIEVLEHMPAREAETAIANICAHTDDVLFSSSPFDFREPTHINVHGPEYWAEQFARHQCYRDVDFDASFITPWAIRFRRRTDPIHRIIRDYERRYWELLRESNDARSHAVDIQAQLASTERERNDLRAALAAANRQLEGVNAECQRLEHERVSAVDTIFHMERSLFWRARGLWQRIRGR